MSADHNDHNSHFLQHYAYENALINQNISLRTKLPLSRRTVLTSIAASAALFLTGTAANAQNNDLSREMILNDPAAPVTGNQKGDVTIVSFFDYNCPYCKRTVSPLDKVMAEDGRIRLVYKDWPILSESSIIGAKLALAANYQGKYDEAHRALMKLPGGRVTADQMRKAVYASKVDVKRLERDLKSKNAEISKLLQRNNAQAEGLGLQGTPVFLIGQFIVASPLDEEGFREVIDNVRNG